MANKQLLRMLQDLDDKIRDYRQQLANQGIDPSTHADYSQIVMMIIRLPIKHIVTGAAGQPCIRCDGTGREP
jgi:hypothetical protein